MLISVELLTNCVVITYIFGSVREKFIFGILWSLTSFGVLKTLTGSADLKKVSQNMVSFSEPSVPGGGTAIYGLYRYVPL